MKHIFIVNPTAGKYDHTQEIRDGLNACGAGYDWEIYITGGKKDAIRYVNSWCEAHPDTPVRFYACGGDGTINEVARGILGRENASFSVYPCGSGNDFVKYYGTKERFLNIENLLRAEEHRIDAISANGYIGVNTVSFGYDSAVCKLMQKIKRYPLIGGKNAYYVGAFLCLLYAMHTKCRVLADGEEIAAKEILLCTVANGRYIGGSFKCAPRSFDDDGLLEVCCIKNVSIPRFLSLIGPYSKGEHLDDPRCSKYVTYRRSTHLQVEAAGNFWVCLDGELENMNKVTIDVLPGALRFAVPAEI